jgi:hypothetical protein
MDRNKLNPVVGGHPPETAIVVEGAAAGSGHPAPVLEFGVGTVGEPRAATQQAGRR